MSSEGTSLLFVSGSGLPQWIWDDTRHGLATAQITSVAPRPREPSDLTTYAHSALDAARTHRFVVVAHSVGAVVALKMVELAPGRVASILAIAGVVPAPGGSFLCALPFPSRVAMHIAIRVAGTRPPEKAIRKGLCSSLDQRTADRIVADFAPESAGLFRGRLGPAEFPAHTGYVRTTADREVPSKLQDRFIENLQPHWTQSVDTGHLPMLEAPSALSDAIDSFTDDGGHAQRLEPRRL